ncbi:MAG TPA: trehalose-6-phosphate synthase [Pseudolabrys sp.]|nr:trehalose-6-phosphate synthase [Pseudolabrys sp.]
MNVVVVSNRVARVEADGPMAGGLAAALLPAVKSFGAVWVGSSGRTRKLASKDSFAEVEAFGKGALATVDLPESQYKGYYEGFSNSALWPALHSRADLIRSTEEDYACYREINAYMARALLRFCKPDATYWVQDYHFLALGAELRRLGVDQPIGFFLHTPWADRSSMICVPQHKNLVRAMLAYDLIGFQTDDDRHNFVDYLRNELRLAATDDGVTSEHGTCRFGTFPIGIDVDAFAARSAKAVTSSEVARLRQSLQGNKLVIGVDRVDYSKGLCNRMRAFDRLLTVQPNWKRQVRYVQIAVPSRGNIGPYKELQAELAATVGEINGRHGEIDWTPIRYLNKGFSQASLAGFYRSAQVGLVTPLHDGMNLVAKEYVAAQNPADPGMLVLSQFAGAAKELDTALLVNPHDIDAIAQRIATALRMSGDERRERWNAMMNTLRTHSVHAWFSEFVDALSTSRETLEPAAEPTLVPAVGGRTYVRRSVERFS